MRIGIDVREALKPKPAGKGQWTRGFYDELLTRDVDCVPYDSSKTSGLLWHMQTASAVRRSTLDAYVSPTSFIVPAFLRKSVPVIPIVHDLIAFHDEPHNRKAKLIERFLLQKVLRNAVHVCTVSEATKHDLLSRFPFVSPDAVTPIFAGPMSYEAQRAKSNGKTILCIGTLCPRKNQLRLIEAYAQLNDSLRSQYSLTLVGARGWEDAKIVQRAKEIEGVQWLDYVSDDEYANLLSACTILAYPSLYEGFGMQVLDALQRGIPVLTSKKGSLSEVTGSAAVHVDPEDTASISAGLSKLLRDDVLRADLSAKGMQQAEKFSWKRTVDLFLECVERAL